MIRVHAAQGKSIRNAAGKNKSYEEGIRKMRMYVNQAGYLPEGRKLLLLAEAAEEERDEGQSRNCLPETVKVFDQNGYCILEKEAEYQGYDCQAGDLVWKADISELSDPGEYRIEYEKEQISCNLKVSGQIYEELCSVLSKAYYFQRCGTELEAQYAGKFKRECCHTTPAVRLEDAQKMADGTGTEEIPFYDVRGGWHDAGDYGRYVTAASTALAHLLYAYRFFPETFLVNLNLPESGNGIPDLLNECLYELKWLLNMQLQDGSVCHKLTSMRHANFVMPARDKRQLLLFPPSSLATADFAAVMALASRIYAEYDADFSCTALNAAKRAWNWLEKHPEFIGFTNPEGCNTGDYADTDDRDERLWAAAELYRTVKEDACLREAERLYAELEAEGTDTVSVGWKNVSGFAGWCLLEEILGSAGGNGENNTGKKTELSEKYLTAFLREADRIAALGRKSRYGVALEAREYTWGSNMTVLNRAMLLGTAYLLRADDRYTECVAAQMDYLLGVNAVGYSYVTGVGEHAFMNPHNRVTVADGMDETIPGFVCGGPNAQPADEKAEWLIEPGTPPMKCYLDLWECYSLNEITIYWNSPAIFVSAFLNTEPEKKDTQLQKI